MADAAVSKEGLFIPVGPILISLDLYSIAQLIDFSKFLNGTPSERTTAAKAILDGFRGAGFVYLKNHTIPAPTLSHVFSMSARFFAQTPETKQSLCWTTPQANRGYSAPGREKVTQLEDIDEVDKVRAKAPDLKETYEIGRDDEVDHPNQWPREEEDGCQVRGFKGDMMGFFEQCKAMHIEVMRAIAVGMDMQESFFDGFTDVGDNTLRLLHYPEVKTDVFKINPGQVRAGEHSVRTPSSMG